MASADGAARQAQASAAHPEHHEGYRLAAADAGGPKGPDDRVEPGGSDHLLTGRVSLRDREGAVPPTGDRRGATAPQLTGAVLHTQRSDRYRDDVATRSAFPLRLRDERLRGLVRELAARDRVSQNEFIKSALEREVIVRGVLATDETADAAQRLRNLTEDQLAALVDRSVEEFVVGEAMRDVVEPTALHTPGTPSGLMAAPDRLGVFAAFEAARTESHADR